METDKLLIVDDNENNLFTFAQILDAPDRELTCVASGKEALAALLRQPYSLVLMDVQMPEMDGFKTAKIMNSMSKDQMVPIIFISAVYKTPEFIAQGFELGAFDYITKPVDAYLLRNKVNVFLKLTRQEQELKALNMQLEASNRDLEDRVRSRTRDVWLKHRQLEDVVSSLKTQKKERKDSQERLKAQDRLATLGAMAAGVAHELKNPLNFVLNFSNIINDIADELKEWKHDQDQNESCPHTRPFEEILEDLSTSIQMIHQHGLRADNTIKSILKSAHVESERPSMTDINKLLTEALKLATFGSDSLNVKVETHFQEDPPMIMVASASLIRVFLNLATNAFYALEQKKRRLGENFSPELTISTRVADPWLVVEVGDNGDGVPQDKLDMIFDPFFTTKPPGEGTGLGLHLSREIIVMEHCGRFEARSVEGEGVTFSISLPLKPPAHCGKDSF